MNNTHLAILVVCTAVLCFTTTLIYSYNTQLCACGDKCKCEACCCKDK